jgi:hypothetical protein
MLISYRWEKQTEKRCRQDTLLLGHEAHPVPGGGSGKAAGGGRASRRRIQGNDRELAWPSTPTSGVCQRAAIRHPGCGRAVGQLL